MKENIKKIMKKEVTMIQQKLQKINSRQYEIYSENEELERIQKILVFELKNLSHNVN